MKTEDLITPEWAVSVGFELYEDLGDQVCYIHPNFPNLILSFDHDVIELNEILGTEQNGDYIYVCLFYDSDDFKYTHQVGKVFSPHFYS
jgi:hypothetical protein